MKKILIYIVYLLCVLEIAAMVILFLPDRWMKLPNHNRELFFEYQWMRRRIWAPRLAGDAALSFDVYDPLTGWRLRPGVVGQRFWRDKTVNSNSKGVRGLKEYVYKPDHRIRIVLIGDSFTFGDEVSDEETWAYYLQRLLGDMYEVINMGIHGYGHDQMLVYLREEAMKYDPDVVILGFFEPDMDRNMMRFRDYAKPLFDVRNNELHLIVKEVPSPDEMFRSMIFRWHLLDIIKLMRAGPIREGPKVFKLTELILDEMRKIVEKNGAKFMVIYLPKRVELLNQESSGRERFVRAYTKRNQISFFSIRPYLMERSGQMTAYLKDGIHYDPKVNQMVAEGFYAYLKEEGVLMKKIKLPAQKVVKESK